MICRSRSQCWTDSCFVFGCNTFGFSSTRSFNLIGLRIEVAQWLIWYSFRCFGFSRFPVFVTNQFGGEFPYLGKNKAWLKSTSENHDLDEPVLQCLWVLVAHLAFRCDVARHQLQISFFQSWFDCPTKWLRWVAVSHRVIPSRSSCALFHSIHLNDLRHSNK